VYPPGVAALRRWGLLDAVIATGCPPIETYCFGSRSQPRRKPINRPVYSSNA